jgi:hypothetical protein
MITKTIAAGLIAITSLAAVPANAGGLTVEFGFGGGHGQNWGSQGGGHNWGGHGPYRHQARLSTQEVRFILRGNGYRNIQFVDNRGPVYQLRARKNGRTFFLVVSARDGEILSRQRI